MLSLRTHTLALLSIVALLSLAAPLSASVSIRGEVRSPESRPIPGATVIVQDSGTVVAGTASDNNGRFNLKLHRIPTHALDLRISSVGYETASRTLTPDRLTEAMTIELSEVTVEVPGMTVSPLATYEPRSIMRQDVVVARAAQSLVMSNPVAALKQPQVSRVGSNHSSQIRVHGTSPAYFLNGLPIGTDPSHYGMFSYVPASIVEKMDFQPLGTPVDEQLPSIVTFDTPELFGRGKSADLTLSTVEATGTFSVATDHLYAQGSLRKSVLDRLVNQLDISTDRATLPPTNFQDVFGTVGVRLSQTSRLMIDHYQVRDFLSYNTSAVASITAIDTYQASQEKQVGVRLEDNRTGLLTHMAAASRWGSRDYKATPTADASAQAVRVDLDEKYRTDFAEAGIDLTLGRVLLKTGWETEQDRYRDYALEQHNWNFLPPFANTDNPFIYQHALNEIYGERSGDARQGRTSAWLSGEIALGAATLMAGLRRDAYTPLSDGEQTGFRTRLRYALGANSGLSLTWGTYSNSPLDNILESYQVIVRAGLDRLSPVLTELSALQINHGGFSAGAFRKTLRNLPVVAPDFSGSVSSGGDIAGDFISMKSEGNARFDGFFVTAQTTHPLGGRLGLTVSYAYTVSRYCDHDIVNHYDLDAPHRFLTQIDYRCSRKLSLGAELQVRSGYPYSPLRSTWSRNESDLYEWEYYRAAVDDENSLRFATNAYLNLSGRYQMGRVELLMSVANVTNRENPVVYSSAGLIYDAGILPMIGFRMSF